MRNDIVQEHDRIINQCFVELNDALAHDVDEYADVFLMQLKYLHEMVSHHINVLWG